MKSLNGIVQFNLGRLFKEIESMTVSSFLLDSTFFYKDETGLSNSSSLYLLQKNKNVSFEVTSSHVNFIGSVEKNLAVVASWQSPVCQENVHLLDNDLERYMHIEFIEIMSDNSKTLMERIKEILNNHIIKMFLHKEHKDLILVVPLSVK